MAGFSLWWLGKTPMQVWEPLIVWWFHTFLGWCIVGVTLFHDVPCVRIGTVCCEQKKSTCNFAVAHCRRMQAELRKKRKSGEALVVQQDMELSVHLPVFAHLSICVSALWGASKWGIEGNWRVSLGGMRSFALDWEQTSWATRCSYMKTSLPKHLVFRTGGIVA